MDIVIGRTTPVLSDPSKENVPDPTGKKVIRRDRRKKREDRRRSVREGIYVTISVKDDRRVVRDRRRKPR
jgi:hypothetical protein